MISFGSPFVGAVWGHCAAIKCRRTAEAKNCKRNLPDAVILVETENGQKIYVRREDAMASCVVKIQLHPHWVA